MTGQTRKTNGARANVFFLFYFTAGIGSQSDGG
jgi:hypothetical protein